MSIDGAALEPVFHFLMTVLTSPMKKGLLALAYARRKRIGNFQLGGECALQMQLYVKDADPNPLFEIRSPDSRHIRQRLARLLEKSSFGERPSLEVVRDNHIRPELSVKMGFIPLSRPEKIAVDALSENRSEVYVDQILESIRNSREKIDLQLLKEYAIERGVLKQTMEHFERPGLAFP